MKGDVSEYKITSLEKSRRQKKKNKDDFYIFDRRTIY